MTVKKQTFKEKLGESFKKVYEQSFCAVKVFKDANRLCGMWVEFGGPATKLISKANTMAILYKFGKGRVRIPYIGKSADQRGKESALSNLLTEALIRDGYALPHFEGKTDIQAYIAHHSGRWDSHNISKFLGDWLQSLGVIGDDSDAEIKCFKKADYLDDTEILGTTQIIIQPRDQVSMLTEDYIGKSKRASTGYKYIG